MSEVSEQLVLTCLGCSTIVTEEQVPWFLDEPVLIHLRVAPRRRDPRGILKRYATTEQITIGLDL